MPSFKLKGAKAQEVKSGFEPYDGPVPSRNGFYRGVIKVMKWGSNSKGSSGFNITIELQAAPGDPKNHAQFDGYPMFSRSIITESADGAALKEGAQRNLDNLLAALGTKDEPDVVLADDQDADKVDVKKIGGRNPIGAVVNVDVQMKMYEGERRPEVGGIYKYKEIEASESAVVVTDDDDEADLMEGSDEAEDAAEESDDEFEARKAELTAMGVAELRSLAKTDYDLKSSGSKQQVIDRILDHEFPVEDEDAEDAEEADEPEDTEEAEDADEAEEAEDEDDDEAEEADETDDEEREARVAELADLGRPALKSILKEIAPDFTVLKRHTDDDLRSQIIGVEFADDLPF